MFGLFGKNKAENLEKELEEYCRKRNWAGLAKACYHLGVSAMKEGNLNKAQLWLSRADTIYSADDGIYEKVGEKLVDDCSERIGQLEEEPLLYHTLPARIESAADNLKDIQVRIWGLLSLARLVKLGERLADLPGCKALGRLGWAVDTVFRSFQNPITEEEAAGLRELCGALYELGDSMEFWGLGSQIAVPEGAPFQIFDFNGMLVLLEMDAYLDSHLKMLAALSQGEEVPAPEKGIISGALLPDYHVRTGTELSEETPKIKAELGRIWDDYTFICSGLTMELVEQKMKEYKNLDILA